MFCSWIAVAIFKILNFQQLFVPTKSLTLWVLFDKATFIREKAMRLQKRDFSKNL